MTLAPVRILQLEPSALVALAEGDLATAQEHVAAPLTPWLVVPENASAWRFRARQAVETPEDLPWMTGLLVDDASGQVVGRAGFHGAPDDAGMVEVGYAVDPAMRRRGYARAALEQLIERSRRESDVVTLRATVAPDNEASLGLIAGYPFVRNGEQWDDEDGLELIFELPVG